MQIWRFKWGWEPFPHLKCENGSERGIGMDCPEFLSGEFDQTPFFGLGIYIFFFLSSALPKIIYLQGLPRKGFEWYRISSLFYYIHYLSIPLDTNSWSDNIRSLLRDIPCTKRSKYIVWPRVYRSTLYTSIYFYIPWCGQKNWNKQSLRTREGG